MCGVIGIYDNEEVISKMYSSMLTIQHRGQDAAGILTYDGESFHLKKGLGLVQDIFDSNNIPRLTGNIAIGHTRYPTVGGGTKEDAQPYFLYQPFGIAGAHNGNVTNFFELKKELYEQSHKLVNSNCDGEVILHILADYLDKYKNQKITSKILFNGVKYVHKRVKGSYSTVVYIAGIGMLAFRDPQGLRPLVMGNRVNEKGVSYAFASESVSLEVIDFTNIKDVEAGEAIFIDLDRNIHKKKVTKAPFRPCIFEYIYFARPDSTLNGINVYQSRVEMGKKLAKKIKKEKWDIDTVIPVPDSARTAAIEISNRLKIKYREGLVKNRYIGRTFIMPGNKIRQKSIREKLNPIRNVIKGQNILLIDDSIVRGNTSKAIIRMLKESGAKKIFLASYSSPLLHQCVYGVDMQTKEEFIARNLNNEQIAQKLGADAIIYQDINDMEQAVREQNKKIKSFCKACFTGKYPTKDVSTKILDDLEAQRLNIQKQEV